MSRFTLKSLRNTRIKLVSKYDPAIDWEAMQRLGIYFEVEPGADGVAYDAKKHSEQVVTLEGTQALAFYCHSPTVRERITAFEQAGIEVDSESGVRYIGASGSSGSYAPGNGALVGMTSAYKRLAYLVIDSIAGVDVDPFKVRNAYGLLEVSPTVFEQLAPMVDGEVYLDALEPILIEIGTVFLTEDEDAGKF